MKKTILKGTVFVLVFFLALIVSHRIMNQGHENITMDMAPAEYPVMSMVYGDLSYNLLHGYAQPQDISCQHDAVTVLGEGRSTDFVIDPYGQRIERVRYEVRNIDDGRLIEESEVAELEKTGARVRGTIVLKDLIKQDVEYMLRITTVDSKGREVYFYTRIAWSPDTHAEEKLAFALDFHEKLFDKEEAKSLTKYMETNADLNDNSTFAYVDIHSSFAQITYGDLGARESIEPLISYRENIGSIASFRVDSLVEAGTGEEEHRYFVREYFRIRYAEERIYLLNYERTMEQLPEPENMCTNDKIALGIRGEDVHMAESEDGNTMAFVTGKTLFCYTASNGKLARVFSFWDDADFDDRTLYDAHDIKILECSEDGNMAFAVYGYMNRGRHEGEVGIALYNYDSSFNTVEELLYIPYEKTAELLMNDMDQLLYLNRSGHLYFTLNDVIYLADLENRSCEVYGTQLQDDTMLTNADHRIMVNMTTDEDGHVDGLMVTNLKDETKITLLADAGEALRFLGFIGDDLVYGLSRKEDIRRESTGRYLYPLYRICISTEGGRLLKDYEKNGYYVTGCEIEDNLIRLTRSVRTEDGDFEEADTDNISTSEEVSTGKNRISTAVIDIYERYVQIQTRSQINVKALKIFTPKEVVYEGGREMIVEAAPAGERFYVYNAHGLSGSFHLASRAVEAADASGGVVLEESGNPVWKRAPRVIRNQIMAITEESITEDKDSLAVCLDTILRYEGVIRNSDYLLGQGQSVLEILEENLPEVRVLDLTGCTLDNVLYYVNMDIPVLALMEDGSAVLITGFNESQIVVMDPRDASLEKKSTSSQRELFESQGNVFITYAYKSQERG